ncbi:MAG: hypothetical protein WKF31_11250 [Thermoleophilaceae bacterium]
MRSSATSRSRAGRPGAPTAPEDYTAEALLERKGRTVSVIVPARSVAGTIGAVVEALVPLERLGLIDELVVVDAASGDGTAERAEIAGATVLQESDLMPDHGPARGKGDAMWRGLAATTGDDRRLPRRRHPRLPGRLPPRPARTAARRRDACAREGLVPAAPARSGMSCAPTRAAA